MLLRKIFVLTTLALTLAACAVQPDNVMSRRHEYNDVARNTENEQLLKNIVRLRYSENTYFLKISSITTSYSLSSSISTSPSLSYSTNGPGTSWSVSRSLGLSPSVSYSESPTLSYVPIEEAAYVKQMQTPLTLAQILIPYNSGGYSEIMDFGYLARIVFDIVGPYPNAATLSSNKIYRTPHYKHFYEMLDLIMDMWKKGALEIRQRDVNMISLQFYKKADAESFEGRKLKRMLHVPLHSDVIYLSDSFSPCKATAPADPFAANSKPNFPGKCKPSKAIHVQLRSVLEIVRFLSYSVEVPESDIKSGYVLAMKNPDGTLFNLSPLMQGLLKISSSDSEPRDDEVYVKTYFRHHWFYIKNSDTDSKETFTFLQYLITLVAGTVATPQSQGPILTLPVSH